MRGFRRRPPAALLLAPALLGLAGSCSNASQPSQPAQSVGVRLVDGEIEVRNAQPDFEARFMTFERRGERSAYGVYGAYAAKSHMQVPKPLDGDAIAWPDRDHVQALIYLLHVTGVEEAEARARVESGLEVWFREGLRVFVVAPDTLWIHELTE